MQSVQLSSSHIMPLVGIGTTEIQGRDTIYQVIDENLKGGFRSIAGVYRNEKAAPSDYGIPIGIEDSLKNSLWVLNATYINLYLINWLGAMHLLKSSTNNPDLHIRR
ncbi:uncharacterized protein LOC143360533 isoform X2 [Halictus rubicundus]|uniref:uncharacterized protein LOC143360533 isoform X2 n=1 Tax=Halictus rubicundus TaxID=77578 RepID=UPI004035CF4C